MIFCTRTSKVLLIGLSLLLSLTATGYTAPENDCPERLGVVNDSRISLKILGIMRKVYQNLGCPITIEYLPGRRGLVAFNAGHVDGELFRVPAGAKKYTRSFVQSAVPLMNVSSSLWGNPGSTLYSDAPIGHTIGIVWEEDFLSQYRLPKSGHLNDADLIHHYNAGTFDRFIAEDSTIRSAIAEGAFAKDRIPVQIEVLQVAQVYHYLAAEYAPFMERLSDYLEHNNPFENAEIM